jgi:TolB-like protein
MMTSIWPDAVVEEGNLAKQISQLRKILSSDGEVLIETLPKHGYRFSADLRRIRPTDEPVIFEKHTVKRVAFEVEGDQGGRPALPPKKRSSFGYWVVLAVLIGFALIAGIWYWNRTTATSNAKIQTMAVLPIKPLSEEENNKTLAVGLTDALITKLGSLRPLVVRSGSSVAQFTQAPYDPIDVGRKLDVNAVLEGALMQSEGKLRVNVRLLDTQTGQQLWEDRFEGAFTDLFDLEDRISEKTARNLLPKLTGEPERITKRFTESREAFDSYLKGRYFWNKRSEDGFRPRDRVLQRCCGEGPELRTCLRGTGRLSHPARRLGRRAAERGIPQGAGSGRKARQLDGELAEAAVSLAFVEWVHGWNFPQSEALFRQAMDLSPNYALAHHWYSYFLVSMGRHDEAIAEIKKARELEGPLSLSVNTDIGEIYSWAGRLR